MIVDVTSDECSFFCFVFVFQRVFNSLCGVQWRVLHTQEFQAGVSCLSCGFHLYIVAAPLIESPKFYLSQNFNIDDNFPLMDLEDAASVTLVESLKYLQVIGDAQLRTVQEGGQNSGSVDTDLMPTFIAVISDLIFQFSPKLVCLRYSVFSFSLMILVSEDMTHHSFPNYFPVLRLVSPMLICVERRVLSGS